MGTFTSEIWFANPQTPAKKRRLDALVDTGAFYSWIPASLLKAEGVTAEFHRPFKIATGEVIERDCCDVLIHINGEYRHCIAVFGDEDSPVLLGAHALEAFGLMVDPVNRKLIALPSLPAV